MTESSTTDRLRSEVKIVPATYDDLPGIATCELLASSGAFPPYDTFSRLLSPFRAPLAESHAHPRYWPDYNPIIRKHARNLREGSLLFVAFAEDEHGKEMVVGLAKVTPPREMLEDSRRSRKWKERVLADVVYPAVDNVRDKLWKENDGMDRRFLALFRKLQKEALERVDRERRFFYLNLLFVHPSFRGRGIGSTLLDHCTSIADTHGIPIMVESSPGAFQLYKSRGFVQLDVIEFTYTGEQIQMPCMVRQPVPPTPPPKDEDRTSDIVLGQDSDKEEEMS